MKSLRPALLALPALLCSVVTAVSSPTAYDQAPLQIPSSESHPPSRWRSFSTNVVEFLVDFSRAKEEVSVRPQVEQQQLPSHTFARYGGDLVLRFNISTSHEAASLAEAADTLLLDVWEFSQDWVDIRLSKETVPLLLGLLPPTLQDSHAPLLREKDLAQAILDNYHRHDRQPAPTTPAHLPTRRPFSPALEPASGAETNIFFADYQPFSVIEPWMRLLASLFTTHVRHVDIGLTYEGRSIPGLRVGVHPTNSDAPNRPKRKTILVVGSLHAREWISTTTVNYIAYSLITGYGKIASITHMLEQFDFVFIPTLNPDGYVYTWETDRLWRKNRQETGIRFCRGIDLDRAFGTEWSATDNPCSESFSGESPFQATEAQRLATWARNETSQNNVDFVGFLDLHSYSQQILYPYSYSCVDTPAGLENLEELALGLSKAIRLTTHHAHPYEVMPACEGNVAYSGKNPARKSHSLLPRLEESGGSALDFFYRDMGVRYAYQIKLRDRGTYGFLLPKEHIVPTGKEILNAVLYFGEFLRASYDVETDGPPSSPSSPPSFSSSFSNELAESRREKLSDGEEEADADEDDADVDEEEKEEEEDDDDDPWVVIEDLDLDPTDAPNPKLYLKQRRRRR